MKNFLFTLALLLASITLATAQTTIGIRGGLHNSGVRFSEALGNLAPDLARTNGFEIGAFANIPVTGGFSIQPELIYQTKGFGYSQDVAAELLGVNLPLNATAETRFDYIAAPLLGKYAFGDPQGIQAYVTAGPSIGYALSGRVDTRARVLVEFDIAKTPINLDAVNYQRLEVSGIIGAGVQIPVGNLRAFVDARYQHGFTNAYKVPVVNEYIRNSGVSLSAGLAFPIGR